MPQALAPSLQKYRTLLIAIALFLFFDLGVLVPTFILSARIKQDAIAINLAGRQRMLSQRTVKALLQLKIDRISDQSPEQAREELATVYQLFDNTLQGFAVGQMVTGGNGEPVFLEAAASVRAKALVQEALDVWQPYRTRLLPVLESDPSLEELSVAIAYAEDRNLVLLDLMNQLTSELEQGADRKALTLQIIQISGLILALTNFFIFVGHSLRRLRVRDRELQQSQLRLKRRTEELQNTIDHLQRAQIQLIQSEKMSSLGQLVAGVAHELNNPLSFVEGNLFHLNQYTEELLTLVDSRQTHAITATSKNEPETNASEFEFICEDLPRVLASMNSGTKRIKRILKSLRTFSRLDESDYKEADLRDNLDSTLMLIGSWLQATPQRPAIALMKQYDPIPPFNCYPGQLNQVFLHCLTNAIAAIDAKCAQNPGAPDYVPEIRVQACRQDESAITIHIQDNGIGMLPEVREKIFDPFFTTKDVGQGTGLGLYISYQVVVEQHGGSLTCWSEPGIGTQFSLCLPRQVPQPPRTAASALSAAGRG